MKRTIKQFLKRYLWFLLVCNKLLLRKKSYLHKTGWIESIKRGYPCDDIGSQVPWMNHTIINILKERLNKDLKLFEYGSGYSTLFYARHVHSVISIEYDTVWFDLMASSMPSNTNLIFQNNDIDGNYCRTIHNYNQEFDVVIVDGRDRVNCVKQAIEKLSKKGIILLDDSSRERYSEAFDYAKENGFKNLSLAGLKPTGFGIDETTILYRTGNCFNI